MPKDWPVLLRHLSEELDYKIVQGEATLGNDLFFVDLSDWKLRLSNRTPVIWIQSTILRDAVPRHLLQSIQDVIRQRNLARQTVIVLLEGDSLPLVKYTASSPLYNLIILGAEEQKKICQSRRPSGELLDLISVQVPISDLAPYETRSPVTGSRFFGREYERNKILGNPDTNHVVLGIRRIGKTSLLREIERILKEEEEDAPHIVYMDCSDLLSTEDYIREVVRRLNPRELPRLEMQKYVFYFPDFLERMRRKYRTKIVFLLDEIDNLVVMQRGGWDLFRMLRTSATTKACQYIIAGYREAWKEQLLIDSPFFNFAQPLTLNELTRQQAHDLIVTPMENLGVHFHNKQEIVGRIYGETAGHPNLIQYYCMILLKQMDLTGNREISVDNLIDIYTDEGFKDHLLASFMQNTQNREKALVYAILRDLRDSRSGAFPQSFMDAALRKRGIVIPQMDIDEACKVLILAGIFHHKNGEYSFTSPVFAKMLQQSYELDYLLGKVKEEGL